MTSFAALNKTFTGLIIPMVFILSFSLVAQGDDCIHLTGDAVFLRNGTKLYKDSSPNSTVLFVYYRDSVKEHSKSEYFSEDAKIIDSRRTDGFIYVNTLVADSVWVHADSLSYTSSNFSFAPRIPCEESDKVESLFEQQRQWLENGYCKANVFKLLVFLDQLCICNYEGKNYSEAVYLISQLIDYKKEYPSLALNNITTFDELLKYRAVAKMKLEDYRGAINDLDVYLINNTEDSGPFGVRAYCLTSLGRWEESILDYSKAIKLKPTNAHLYFYRGLSYKAVGKVNEACLDLSKAGELGAGEAYDVIKEICN